jgi:divalent metal cation (Fe/Co/Zn/Cd) transporter
VFAGVVSVRKLVEHCTTTHIGFGIAAAAAAIIANQVVARYKCALASGSSPPRWSPTPNTRWLDALSSPGAALGLIGGALGLSWADALAGLW